MNSTVRTFAFVAVGVIGIQFAYQMPVRASGDWDAGTVIDFFGRGDFSKVKITQPIDPPTPTAVRVDTRIEATKGNLPVGEMKVIEYTPAAIISQIFQQGKVTPSIPFIATTFVDTFYGMNSTAVGKQDGLSMVMSALTDVDANGVRYLVTAKQQNIQGIVCMGPTVGGGVNGPLYLGNGSCSNHIFKVPFEETGRTVYSVTTTNGNGNGSGSGQTEKDKQNQGHSSDGNSGGSSGGYGADHGRH